MLSLYATDPVQRRPHRTHLPRLTLVLALFLAGFTMVAQPGLCSCWLLEDVATNHPHPDGHPERPHSHDYLFEMFVSGLVAPPPQTLIPAGLLVAHLASQGLHRPAATLSRAPAIGWQPAIEPPPPRGVALLLK